MQTINNWNEVKETGGEIENLPAGGYICKIEKCEEKPNKNNNGTHLEILFDVCEGNYKGWFSQDWKNQNREDKFWRGIIRQNVPNESSPKYDMQCGFFKRFINNIEKSNEGYHWDWNEAGLEGKKVGIIFREIERESSRGTRYIVTQADSTTSIDNIENGKYRVPAPKMLPVVTETEGFAILNEDDGDLPF